MKLYTVLSWMQSGDRGHIAEFFSSRAALKYAAGDARQIGARRVAVHNSDYEVARWRNTDGGGVLVASSTQTAAERHSRQEA